jgi:threonine dehydrogenase-like Zn-dependent dehydrogenase
LGVRFAAPGDASGDADLVVHASGSPDGLDVALRLAGFESTVVDLSWYGDRRVPVPLGEAFHSRRLTLKSSQVGHVAASQRARWTHRRRMALALDLLGDSTLDALISGESDFEALPEVMAGLARAPQGALCHRIKYQERS